MSKRFRQRRAASMSTEAIDLPITPDMESGESYELYDPSAQQYSYFLGGNSPQIEFNPSYPGPREIFHPEADRYTPITPNMDGQGNDTYNMIDREIGGQRGWIDDLPYSTGVVSSDLMENYALTGEQAVIRRGRNPSDHGPVATADYNAGASLRFAMNTNQYYPNEASQSDLVRSV